MAANISASGGADQGGLVVGDHHTLSSLTEPNPLVHRARCRPARVASVTAGEHSDPTVVDSGPRCKPVRVTTPTKAGLSARRRPRGEPRYCALTVPFLSRRSVAALFLIIAALFLIPVKKVLTPQVTTASA
jgi:hypothetical protein